MRTFTPLELAYARTIHKFQGLSAGPVDAGKIPNPYLCIICDPDQKKYEGKALGLFYTAISRATTLGDKMGLNSAIYFTGDFFDESRIQRLTHCKDSNIMFKSAVKRHHWVTYLQDKEILCKRQVQKIIARKRTILKECNTPSYTYDHVYARLRQYQLSLIQPGFSI